MRIRDRRINYISENKRRNETYHLPSLSVSDIHSFVHSTNTYSPGTVATVPTKYNDPDSGQTMTGNKGRIWSSTLFLRLFLRMLGIPHLEGTERPPQKVSDPFFGQ